MKPLQFQFLILIITTMIIGCDFSSNKQMKRNLSETNQIQSDTEKLSDLFNSFLEKQTQIRLIKYDVQRIDTLVSGVVRNNSGTITIQKNKNDSILSFSFYGKRHDLSNEVFYIDNTYFKINLEYNIYYIKENYGKIVFGTNCGQLILTDLIKVDTTRTKFSLLNIDNNNFLFKSTINNKSSDITKQIIIDKRTLIPNQITTTKINTKQNLKQSITFNLTGVQINDQVLENKLSNLYFKTGYNVIKEATKRTTDDLLGKKVPEIVLNTFENQSINIRSLESQIVLLDFWELWCSPCKKSLPNIEQIAENYNSYGLKTFGVISDTVGSKAYLNENNISINQVMGNKLMNDKLMVNSYPRYVIIDKSGIIQSIYRGYSDNIELDINRLLFK